MSEVRFQQLLRVSTCMFYDVQEVLVMEALINAPRHMASDGVSTCPEWQRDDVIANRLNLHAEQVQTTLARLVGDRMVTQIREETNTSTGSVPCYFYGLEYATASNAIRYKLNNMEKKLNEKICIAQEQTYCCPNCRLKLTLLELSSAHLHPETHVFCCPKDTCIDVELTEIDNSDRLEITEKNRDRFRRDIRPIVKLLDATRGLQPPSYKKPKIEAKETVEEKTEESLNFTSKWLREIKTDDHTPSSSPNLVGVKRKELEEDDDDDEEDVMVMIQGVAKPISEVTEADQEKMSKDEFDRFCDLLNF